MNNVRQMRRSTNNDENDGEGDLRRIAVQIAAQLPHDYERAVKTLELAKRIVTEFLQD